MKSRGQLMDHSEDWVDGSWTVDCVCGVNFDDGEEMVDCDECGVWVHTRCSRYVKGEKSFACDKCKVKNNRNISEVEETEVAQLLVDLPKNAMKRNTSLRLNDASRRPLWHCTEKPIEDRVHVHGIPGGDPQLFSGLSGIFTPQLWKAAGYVPKKFNFRYKEFACWEQDEEKNLKDPLGNQSPFETGADALYSMSKETVFGTRLTIPLGRVNGKGENIANKVTPKEKERASLIFLDTENSLDDSENEKGTRQSFVFTSSQRRKDLLTSHDRTGKRKARAAVKEFDGQKRIKHSGTVSSPASDRRINESSRDKEAKLLQNDAQCAMNGTVLDAMPHDLVAKSTSLPENSMVEANKYPYSNPAWESRSADTANCSGTIEATQKVAKIDPQGTAGINENVMISSSLNNNAEPFSFKEEGAGADRILETGLREKHADVIINTVDSAPAITQAQPSKLGVDSLSSNVTRRVGGLKYMNNHSLASQDAMKIDSIPHCSVKERMVQAMSNAVTDSYANSADLINDISVVPNFERSEDGKKLKVTPENNHGSVQDQNCSESGEATCFTMSPGQRKMAVSVVRSTSTNSVSKSVVSNDCIAQQSRNFSICNKKQVATTGTSHSLKEQGVSSVGRDGERHQKKLKDCPGGSVSLVRKNSCISKYSRSQTSKETILRRKDHESRSFAKAKQDNIVTSDSGESGGSLKAQGASLGTKKVTSSGSSGSLQNGKKHGQVTNSVSSKGSNMASTQRHLLNASHAALSDEKLALLLHQELNSSPRVPRMPCIRMRQAGTLPQSASPTAAHTLLNGTSGFGGNDHTSINPGRETYKLDIEQTSSDSEDGELVKNKVPKTLESRSLSKQHEFRKGKRKARKGRSPVLQSREVKDLPKRRDIEAFSEADDDREDDSLYSNSSERSSSREDDDGEESGAASDDASVSSGES